MPVTSETPIPNQPHPLLTAAAAAAALASVGLMLSSAKDAYVESTLSPNSPVGQRLSKVRIDGDHQYLWASGDRSGDPDQVEWFDLTGSPLDLNGFQYGIGKDRILSIDRPVFVSPDDPRLVGRWTGRNAPVEELQVIGYVLDGDARAYPIALLDHHELVNDTLAGQPILVGW